VAQVVLDRVTKIYAGDVVALEGMNLTVADREFIVLVGPSGCGKTTTLRMVAGLEEVTKGAIRIGARVVNDVAPKDRNVAMVFQNYALYPHMTVYKNMAFGLMLRCKHGGLAGTLAGLLSPTNGRRAREERRSIDQRVRQTAAMLGIENLLRRRPAALSGGQRQRVALGRAIVRQQDVFLFDEPLSNLDAKLRLEMRAELKRLHGSMQTTTIYVTHDQEEAMTLGDRVVVMKDGVVQQVGTPFEIYDRPINRFVAGFVGTPPMNFLQGRIRRDGDRLLFDEGTSQLIIELARKECLAAFVDQPIIMGVRPEALEPTDQPDTPNTLRARVEVTEPLGDRMDVYFSTGSHDHLGCRTDVRAAIRDGQELTLAVDMSRAHFFELGEHGRSVSLPAT
jgi:multiple sugar transport system ATP-binding protein